MHAMIFWGFITLTIATTVVLLQQDFGLPIMYGNFYLYFQSLFVDILGRWRSSASAWQLRVAGSSVHDSSSTAGKPRSS